MQHSRSNEAFNILKVNCPPTKVTTKHLLPIGKESMTHIPIRQLVSAGITELLVVAGKEQREEAMNLPGSGAEADAVSLSGCRRLVRGLQTVIGVIPGDGVLTQDTRVHVAASEERPAGARILLRKGRDPERPGKASLSERNWLTESHYGGCPNRPRRLKVRGVWNTPRDHAQAVQNGGYGFSPGIASRLGRGAEGVSPAEAY